MKTVLQATDIVKTYRIPRQAPLEVLKGVSFSVEEAQRVAIVGRSGSGKTTLLNILGSLDTPNSGQVEIASVPLFGGCGAARRRNRLRAGTVGFVFQNFQLMEELDTLENILLPLAAMRNAPPKAEGRAKAMNLLAKVGLEARAHHLPKELSGGEQQRVALARALICTPRLILADEPTGNLDTLTGAEILDLLLEAGGNGCAVVMVTHSQAAAARCDRVLTLENGVIKG
ncbi:MAG: ABC transporter ATP-binding protein [Kiritimatiellae bacterium]|nr:ABC transporter ATP-binding protein [Kiritimatiellia bacterium]